MIEATLHNGRKYIGKANVVGTWNQTAYVPLKNDQGQTIGMFYVGVPNTRYNQISRSITVIIAFIGLVGLLVAGIISYFIIRSISAILTQATHGSSQ